MGAVTSALLVDAFLCEGDCDSIVEDVPIGMVVSTNVVTRTTVLDTDEWCITGVTSVHLHTGVPLRLIRTVLCQIRYVTAEVDVSVNSRVVPGVRTATVLVIVTKPHTRVVIPLVPG